MHYGAGKTIWSWIHLSSLIDRRGRWNKSFSAMKIFD
jgi:hypothetical protein